jgi:hypothetical protein
MQTNTHDGFFRFDPLKFMNAISPEQWHALLEKNAGLLGQDSVILKRSGWDALISFYLGEEQFGENRYRLSALKKAYYHIKPILVQSSAIHSGIKCYSTGRMASRFPLRWPIEDRFVNFLLQCMLQAKNGVFPDFWPEKKEFAFVVTHDVETERGLGKVLHLAEVEKAAGIRSCFNIVPERYPIDDGIIQELKNQGFEVGVHGLTHDGKLYFCKKVFNQRAARINHYLGKWGAGGFRSPLTHRNPRWMQALDIQYDSSFFDTDPYEPMPGGVMSIWPYFIGHFVELPYTLPQDSTLFTSLGQTTIDIWKQKLDWIVKNRGMALINVHPDYIDFNAGGIFKSSSGMYPLRLYTELLEYVKEKANCWYALPGEIAAYWRKFNC